MLIGFFNGKCFTFCFESVEDPSIGRPTCTLYIVLSGIHCFVQKVLASRKELLEYDRTQKEAAAAAAAALPHSTPSTPEVSPRTIELFQAREAPPCDVTPRER